MNTLNAIKTRRSIRRFTGKKLKELQFKKILQAGFQAPSAHNRHPREFIIIQDDDKLKEVESYHQYAKMLTKAGNAVLVCGDKDIQDNIVFLVCDVSASIQNMLLAAHSMGLGAVWCGIYNDKELTEKTQSVFKLPENIIPIGIIAIGYSEEKKESIDRYDEDKIHYNIW